MSRTKARNIKRHVKSISRRCQKRYLDLTKLSSHKNKKPEPVQDLCTILFSVGLQTATTAEFTNRFLSWKHKYSKNTAVKVNHLDFRPLVLHVETEPIFIQSMKAVSKQPPSVQTECCEHHRHHENNIHCMGGSLLPDTTQSRKKHPEIKPDINNLKRKENHNFFQ